jgi:hypothetical protein
LRVVVVDSDVVHTRSKLQTQMVAGEVIQIVQGMLRQPK